MKPLYKSYAFKTKDPMIDILRTALKDDGIDWRDLPEFTGVSYATYHSWFEGDCRMPRHCTIAATIRSLPTTTQRLLYKRQVVEGIFRRTERVRLAA
jgi:hypothetical protein